MFLKKQIALFGLLVIGMSFVAAQNIEAKFKANQPFALVSEIQAELDKESDISRKILVLETSLNSLQKLELYVPQNSHRWRSAVDAILAEYLHLIDSYDSDDYWKNRRADQEKHYVRIITHYQNNMSYEKIVYIHQQLFNLKIRDFAWLRDRMNDFYWAEIGILGHQSLDAMQAITSNLQNKQPLLLASIALVKTELFAAQGDRQEARAALASFSKLPAANNSIFTGTVKRLQTYIDNLGNTDVNFYSPTSN